MTKYDRQRVEGEEMNSKYTISKPLDNLIDQRIDMEFV